MDNHNNLKNPIIYCLYARKSSESDERQAMSIDGQLSEMKAMAKKERLNVKQPRGFVCNGFVEIIGQFRVMIIKNKEIGIT